MSEKYYVVSESELDAYGDACVAAGATLYGPDSLPGGEVHGMLAACRARPVNAVPGRSTKGEGMCWIEGEV